MKKADLHIHTTASDGLLTPEEVVEWAVRKGLEAIAITDHDTVSGIEPAILFAKRSGIEVIPGIELNTELEDEEIHILGYFIDYKATWFLDKLSEIQNSRYVRAKKMIDKLNEMGVYITFEQVEKLSEKGTIGRPHIARAMMDMGYIKNVKEAFQTHIGKGMPAYVERYKLTCAEAIAMIERLGGVPVLAHPGLIKDIKHIGRLFDLGIKGIEVYHSKHDDETIRNMLQIAKSRALIITGGSDCHGTVINNEPMLGNIGVDYSHVEALKRASGLLI